MTASRLAPSASWSSKATRLRGKHSTLRIHSWLPHGALNGSNGWTHNLEARDERRDACADGDARIVPRLADVRSRPSVELWSRLVILQGYQKRGPNFRASLVS